MLRCLIICVGDLWCALRGVLVLVDLLCYLVCGDCLLLVMLWLCLVAWLVCFWSLLSCCVCFILFRLLGAGCLDDCLTLFALISDRLYIDAGCALFVAVLRGCWCVLWMCLLFG